MNKAINQKSVWMAVISLLLLFSTLFMPVHSSATTSYPKVMWGKVQVTPTTVGKIVVSGTGVYPYTLKSGKAYKGKALAKGEYVVVKNDKGKYYTSTTTYVPSTTKNMKYCSVPADLKAKVLPPVKVMWGKYEVKQGFLGTVTVKKDTLEWKLNSDLSGQYQTLRAGTYPVYGYYNVSDARGERYNLGNGWYVSHIPVDMIFTQVPADLVKKAKLSALPVIYPTAKHYFAKQGEELWTPEAELPYPFTSKFTDELFKTFASSMKDHNVTFEHERVSETGYNYISYVDGQEFEYYFLMDGDLQLSGEEYDNYLSFKSAVLNWLMDNDSVYQY